MGEGRSLMELIGEGQLPRRNKGRSLREWMGAKARCNVGGVLVFLVPSAQSPNSASTETTPYLHPSPSPKAHCRVLRGEFLPLDRTTRASQSQTYRELGAPPPHSTSRGLFYRMSWISRGPPLTLHSARPQSPDPSGSGTARSQKREKTGGRME